MLNEPRQSVDSLESTGAAQRLGPISRRRFLGVTIAGAAGASMAALLAACGGAPASPTAAPAKPAETKPAAAPATTSAPAAKPAESKPAAPQPTAAGVEKPAESKPAAAAPAFAGGGSLKLLMRSHFIPAYDKWFDQWATEWGKKNKVEITVDHILGAELPAKWAAEVATGAGHDLFTFTLSGAINLYNKQLVDLSDLAEPFGKQYGGWVEPLSSHIGKSEGTWKGVPEFFIDFPANYRKDIFDANGLKPVETWQELMTTGELLKAKGNPIGIPINQRSNDANNSWAAFLWSHGVSWAKEDGKYANLNTPAAKEAVAFAIELYKKTMTDEVLSWDDTANNQGLASGRLSWIHNPISSLRTIEKDNPELAKKIAMSNSPAGPKGQFAGVSTSAWGVMNWSKNVPAAKALLVDYYAVLKETLKVAEGYNQPLLIEFRKKPMAILGEDPRFTVLQDFDKIARASGHPGPPTTAASEVEANWIIPLMIGRAVQGSPDDAVVWASEKIEAIYKKNNLA